MPATKTQDTRLEAIQSDRQAIEVLDGELAELNETLSQLRLEDEAKRRNLTIVANQPTDLFSQTTQAIEQTKQQQSDAEAAAQRLEMIQAIERLIAEKQAVKQRHQRSIERVQLDLDYDTEIAEVQALMDAYHAAKAAYVAAGKALVEHPRSAMMRKHLNTVLISGSPQYSELEGPPTSLSFPLRNVFPSDY